MKVKLIKYLEDDILQLQTDSKALLTNIDDYKNWIEGNGFNCQYTPSILSYWTSSKTNYKLTKGRITADKYNRIFFTVSDKASIDNYIYIDIDIKNINADDDTKLQIKDTIINIIKFDTELSSRILSCAKSGIDVNNGLHLIIRSIEPLNKISKNIITDTIFRYIQKNSSIDLHLNDINSITKSPVIDRHAVSTMRWIKSLFGIGFEHFNIDAVWSDLSFNKEPDKLDIPSEYTTGFQNEFIKYIYNTSLNIDEILVLYKDDLEKRPFRTRETLLEKIKHVEKYIGKYNIKDKQDGAIVNDYFYIKNDKININKQKVQRWLEQNYDIRKKNGTFYIKEKTSFVWKSYSDIMPKKRNDMIIFLMNQLNITDIVQRTLLEETIISYLRVCDLSSDIPPRDLDEPNKIYLTLKLINDDIKIIEIKKDSVSFINKEVIYDTLVNVPVNNINLNYDYKDWDIHKSGYFHNIVGEDNYDNLKRIIGYGNHLCSSTINGRRILFLTDGINGDTRVAGTGKSILLNIITKLRTTAQIDESKLTNKSSNFTFSTLKPYTQYLTIDEFPKDADITIFRQFTNDNGLVVDAKYKEITNSDPVKCIICSNYIVSDYKADIDRRIEIGFLRYYDRETRQVYSDIGYSIFEDRLYKQDFFTTTKGTVINTNEWWNGYIAFIIHCCQLHLSKINEYIQPLINEDNKKSFKLASFSENNPDLSETIAENINALLSKNPNYVTPKLKDIYGYKITGMKASAMAHYVITYINSLENYKLLDTYISKQGAKYYAIVNKNWLNQTTINKANSIIKNELKIN